MFRKQFLLFSYFSLMLYIAHRSFARAFFADLFVDFFFAVVAVADVACSAFFYYLHGVDGNECG